MTATEILLDKLIETAKIAKETKKPRGKAFYIEKIKALAETLSAIDSIRVAGHLTCVPDEEEFV